MYFNESRSIKIKLCVCVAAAYVELTYMSQCSVLTNGVLSA